jgi:hypothetical protein
VQDTLGGKNLFNKNNAFPFKTLDSPDQPTLNSVGFKRFGKKLYVGAALIAVVIITVALFIPQGVAAIQLNVDYTVGEKMIYASSMTGTFQVSNSELLSGINRLLPNDLNLESEQTLEVINFDGEFYTLNHSITMLLNDKTIFCFGEREDEQNWIFNIHVKLD